MILDFYIVQDIEPFSKQLINKFLCHFQHDLQGYMQLIHIIDKNKRSAKATFNRVPSIGEIVHQVH